jgi:anti-anti-sigma factor
MDGSAVSTRKHQPTPAPVLAPGDATTAVEPFGASVTVAGADGVPIATITRHRETVADDHALIVVAVIGDIDADSAPLLRLALTEAFTNQSRVCCDLGRATFFGAAGANAFVAAYHRAAAAGCHFAVRGVHGTARWTLAVTGLDRLLTLQD